MTPLIDTTYGDTRILVAAIADAETEFERQLPQSVLDESRQRFRSDTRQKEWLAARILLCHALRDPAAATSLGLLPDRPPLPSRYADRHQHLAQSGFCRAGFVTMSAGRPRRGNTYLASHASEAIVPVRQRATSIPHRQRPISSLRYGAPKKLPTNGWTDREPSSRSSRSTAFRWLTKDSCTAFYMSSLCLFITVCTRILS